MIGAFLFPWAKYGGTRLRIRLNCDHSSADAVLDSDGARLVTDDGAPDLEITTTVAHIARARRTDAPLITEVAGNAIYRNAFTAAFAMEFDSDHS